jgi:hypothetical protein
MTNTTDSLSSKQIEEDNIAKIIGQLTVKIEVQKEKIASANRTLASCQSLLKDKIYQYQNLYVQKV